MDQELIWKQPLNPLYINEGEVHIWKISLSTPTESTKYLIQSLSKDEHTRADRILCEQRRQRNKIARGYLRKILSVYVKNPPTDLVFYYGPHGKPYLYQPNREKKIEFNLSHSENLMVIAISKNSRVGIDLEHIRNVSEKNVIIKKIFSVQDQQIFTSFSEEEKEFAFFSCWTYKEAYLKALGIGLSVHPNKNSFYSYCQSSQLPTQIQINKDRQWSFMRFFPEKDSIAVSVIERSEEIALSFWELVEGQPINLFRQQGQKSLPKL